MVLSEKYKKIRPRHPQIKSLLSRMTFELVNVHANQSWRHHSNSQEIVGVVAQQVKFEATTVMELATSLVTYIARIRLNGP